LANVNTFEEALRLYVDNYMRGVYSLLPATVIAVDYSVPSVDVRPSIYNKNSNGDVVRIADVLDVPLFVLSADGGNKRITLPVKVGDRVSVLFSDSDTTNVMTNKTDDAVVTFSDPNQMFPLCALAGFFTPASPKAIDAENIVLEHGSTKMTLKSDKVVIDADVEINGDVKLNGNQHTTGTTLVEEQLTGQGGMAISGGNGASVAGNIQVTGGDVTADSIGLKSHHHTGDSGGLTGPALA
jgi:phage baseplate assembly protein gpV